MAYSSGRRYSFTDNDPYGESTLPPTYASAPSQSHHDEARSTVYGGMTGPSTDNVSGPSGGAGRPAESVVFQGPGARLGRYDSVYSHGGFSEIAPDDSISVVGERSTAGAPPQGLGPQYGGGASAANGGWQYQDPYAVDDRTKDGGRSLYSGSQQDLHSPMGWRSREELAAGHHTPYDDDGQDGLHSPSNGYREDRDSQTLGTNDPNQFYKGLHGSTSNLPLVDSGASLNTHQRNESDATTIVGSYRDAKRESRLDEPHAETLGYDPVHPSLSPDGSRGFDEEEGQDKYPPATRLDSMPVKPRPAVWKRIFYDTTPVNDKIELHRRGIGVQDRPWMCWLLAAGMIGGLAAEMIRNQHEQGKPISTSPTFNYMIGPSSEIMINTGARFTPCIKYVEEVASMQFACLNVTSSTTTCTTSLESICGFSNYPHQTFRFILPIFLHAGVVHLLLNLFVQFTSSAIIERQMGSLRFLILFIPAGTFGFVLGGNFSLIGQPSVGASGAIFGTHAAVLVDLIAHWGIEYRPGRKLAFLLIEIIMGLALGLIPGIDNFAHIGGFAMGLMLSLALFPMVHQTRSHRVGFLIMRLVGAAGAVVLFIVLYKNFFTDNPASNCEWCRYLSCWPTAANNRCKGTGLSTTTTTVSSKRALAAAIPALLPMLSLAVRRLLA